jgi:transposase InsO family protein
MEYQDRIPLSKMCSALRYPRASYYRLIAGKERIPSLEPAGRPRRSVRKLSAVEETTILQLLNSPRFCDMAPAEAFTTLLDEGHYYCSVRTMYRLLARNGLCLQRRQRDAHHYDKPELLATRPNAIWSWDITKLKGPAKWQYFLLYTIMDIYSRYIVGWMIAERESDELARELIAETILRQEIVPGTLTLHADRGSSMKSNTVAQLLCDLQVRKTHSRPHVSNDNPFSESNFKTLKYRPDFPERFGSIHDARAHCRRFIKWYNSEHHHLGIAMFTPEQVHYRNWETLLKQRQQVLAVAAGAHPERFVKGTPVVKTIPDAVWINKPNECVVNQNNLTVFS